MFNLNKCATAIAAAMVGTIRTGDDASRFSQRAIAEGFTNISDLIASDAVKQAIAIRSAIEAADPLANAAVLTIQKTKSVVKADPLPLKDIEVLDEFKSEALPFTPLTPAPPAPEPESTASTSTTSETASNVEVDAEGLPWDGRIHSSNKKRIARGDTWQLRRNIDPELVEQVKAELRQVMAIPKQPAPIAAGMDSLPIETAPSSGIVPPAPAETGNIVPPAAAVTPPAGAYSDYKLADLMRGITSKGIKPETVAEVVAQFGVPSVPALATRADLIPLVAEALAL